MAGYATLLRDHVTLTCRPADRIFLQAYVPKLQSVGWVCQFLRWQRGSGIPCGGRGRPRASRTPATPTWNGGGRGHSSTTSTSTYGTPSGAARSGRPMLTPPYPVWIWLNGHEWAKRQLAKGGIGYTALENGFRTCEDPVLLQRLCDRLGPGAVSGFFWRWFHRLPSPFTAADLRAGYVYELAFRQFEVSGTRVFTRPAAGRAFFEGLIRDHPGLGPPARYRSSPAARSAWPGHAPRRGGSAPRSSPTGPAPRSSATTSPAGSSSTSRSTGHCAPRQ